MPLAHTPHRPSPEVQLLQTKQINIKDAAERLSRSLAGNNGEDILRGLESGHIDVPGSSLINFRQVPGIVETLQSDWADQGETKQPADCFVEVHGRLETHMHPCYLGEKLAVGLRGAAGTLLLRFSSCLNCVPLGFTKLKPAGTHAAIVGESPYVHFLVDLHTIGFVPRKGQWLLARVSEHQSKHGVNLLILNCIHCLVRKDYLPKSFHYDDTECKWIDRESKSKLEAERGPVWVQVRDIRNTPGQPLSLTGDLWWPEGGGFSAKTPKKKKRDGIGPKDNMADTAPEGTPVPSRSDGRGRKRDRGNNAKDTTEAAVVAASVDSSSVPELSRNMDPEVATKMKHKKRAKDADTPNKRAKDAETPNKGAKDADTPNAPEETPRLKKKKRREAENVAAEID